MDSINTAWFIIPDGHPLLCEEMVTEFNAYFKFRQINATADWYYDEFVETGTEYGVKIRLNVEFDELLHVLHVLLGLTLVKFGTIKLEVGTER